MPRKVFPDGKPCSNEECERMAGLWDQHSELRERASRGQRLMQDRKGAAETCLPNLENMSHNFLVLKEIVDKMSSRDRLSSEPAESLAKMCVGWYGKHKNHYQNIKNHDAVVWAFKDAWVLHKMFTMLRTKVMRPEEPREPRLNPTHMYFEDFHVSTMLCLMQCLMSFNRIDPPSQPKQA